MTWVRSAFWIGSAKPGQEDAFRDGIENVIMPGLRKLPAVRGADVLWPRRFEPGGPEIACQIVVELDSVEAIDAMLASPERMALRKDVLKVVELFDGSFSHIDFELGAV